METPQLRQTLAIVFCDIAGTTRLFAQEGDLVASAVLRDFFEHSGRLNKEHHCAFMKLLGDGFLAAFEEPAEVVPLARAVQEAFRSVPALDGRGLAFRFSLHFADVLCVETSYGKDILGEEVNLAAHLNDVAEPGEIVVSQAAFDCLPAEQQTLARPREVVRVRSRPRQRLGRRGGRRHRHESQDRGARALGLPGPRSEVQIHRINLLSP